MPGCITYVRNDNYGNVAQPPGAGRRCRLPHYVLNAAWYKRSQASKKMIRKKYPGENQAGEGQ